ncbi:diacylglycerol kinase [Clostridia bacterium]|nr:diacylglycerol kinase [Clostridia bacterium]
MAGNGRAARIAPMAEEQLKRHGKAIQTVASAYPGHIEVVSRNAANAGVNTIFVLGGDSTVTDAARGVFGSKTALALLPAGTGNDFRKSLGIPEDWQSALEFALEHDPIEVDAGMINDQLFVNECGAGFDTVTLEYAQLSKKFMSGRPAYLYGVIRAILDNKTVELTVTREDGLIETRRLVLFGAANGGIIGGGIPVAPLADVRDGLLDVVMVPAMPRWRLIPALRLMLLGQIMDMPGTVTFKCKEISIRGNGLKLNVDGEIVSQDAVTFKIMPRALRIHA